MLRTHLTYVDPDPKVEYRGGGAYPNLWDAHPPFQIDGNFGGTAGIAEMLLQSHTGKVHLLPALPAAWQKGRVQGLVARGALVIDMVWEDHLLQRTTILSKKGGTFKIRYRDKTVNLSLEPGEKVVLNSDLGKTG